MPLLRRSEFTSARRAHRASQETRRHAAVSAKQRPITSTSITRMALRLHSRAREPKGDILSRRCSCSWDTAAAIFQGRTAGRSRTRSSTPKIQGRPTAVNGRYRTKSDLARAAAGAQQLAETDEELGSLHQKHDRSTPTHTSSWTSSTRLPIATTDLDRGPRSKPSFQRRLGCACRVIACAASEPTPSAGRGLCSAPPLRPPATAGAHGAPHKRTSSVSA